MGQQSSRDVAASPEAVWAVVSDITRIGEWSTETYLCEWDEGQQPGLGATFTGHNRYGEAEWSNQGVITEWTPNERLTWDVHLTGPAAERFGSGPMTTWGFVIEPTDAGTRLQQVTEDMRPDDLKALGAKFLPEIADRVKRNYETMDATLTAIAAVCEGS
jgi:uncharacterized protein YndB with AHSA1/START domain